MKTDRFADSIRRKLDSIRPEFSERDWTKMQAMLKQTGPLPNATPTRPRLFSGQAARLIAAGAAGTALFLGTTLYQTYELNRLRNATRQAGQPIVQTDSARTTTIDTPLVSRSDAPDVDTNVPARHPETAPLRDTVYVDRYVRVPAPLSTDQTNRLAATPNLRIRQSEEAAIGRETTPAQQGNSLLKPAQPVNRPADAAEPATVADRQPVTTPPGRFNSSTEQSEPGQSGLVNPAVRSADRVATSAEPTAADRIGNQPTAPSRNPAGTDRDQRVADNAGTGTTGTFSPSTNESAGTRTESARTEPVAAGNSPATKPVSNADVTTGPTAGSVGFIPVQPVRVGSIAWETQLQQRSRRMRPARTVLVGGPAVAKSSNESSAPKQAQRQSAASPVRVRIGAGSDLNGRLWSAGGYAELLAGKHITVSVGLSQATFDNGSYTTEGVFNLQQPQKGPMGLDFRREFGLEKRIDPRHEIINISLQTIRLVMPLTIGYRLPINSSFAITPTLGTILNLQSQEKLAYIIRRPPSFPPYGYSSEYSSDADCQYRKVSMLNNVTLGATVEWQRRHWGIQAGPILTIAAQPDPDWVSSLSGGIRARAFFQF